jgi:hypothetical protein
MAPFSRVHIHAAPSIASNIVDTLQQGDFVRLISDHPHRGWLKAAAQSGQQGWVQSSWLDFSGAIRSSSPDFGFSSDLTSPTAQSRPHLTVSVHLGDRDSVPEKASAVGKALGFGEVIQNGDFEDGQVSWVEQSTKDIIRNDWADPYQGLWVAWLGGLNSATERLTQLFHVPREVKDAQRLDFYLKVTSTDPFIAVNDTLVLRFLDGSGTPVTVADIAIANNTDKGAAWEYVFVDITGMSAFDDQDMQIQFEANLDSSYFTNFVIDSVSFDLILDTYYTYLPLVRRDPTPTPSPTPCSSYCGYDCSSDCTSDCSYDCSYDCSSDCTFECIYECTFDCIYHCAYEW